MSDVTPPSRSSSRRGCDSKVDHVIVMSPASLHARHVLLATQAVFFVCVALCVAVAHRGDAEIYGISYYGVHAPTLPFVVIGYGVGALGLWRTAKYLELLDVPAVLPVGMRVVATGLPTLLIFPYNHGSFFNWAHMTVGTVIGVSQMSIGTFLLVRARRLSASVAVFVQLAGGVLSAVSLPDWGFNHMLDGEIIFEIGFSWCVILWTYVAQSPSLTVSQLVPRSS